MVDLGTLPAGGYSFSHAINDTSQIVGEASTSCGVPCGVLHGFICNGSGPLQDLGVAPGATMSNMQGINRFGHIVGSSNKTSAGIFGDSFLYEGSYAYPPGIPYTNSTGPLSMNDQDQIAGGYRVVAGGNPQAFFWNAGTFTNLGTLPGGSASTAYAMNNAGQVVGYSFTSTGSIHGFLWSSATGMIDLVPLAGWPYAAGSAINDLGYVVGYVYDGSGNNRAVRWNLDHSVADLNALIPAGSGWVLMSGLGINDAGKIVGYGTHNGQPRAFVLTPQ